MAIETFAGMLLQVKDSPIAGCVQPSEPYHQRAARTLCRWGALEEMGLVRLIAEPDYDWEPYCSCDDPDCANKNPDSEAFGSVGQYHLPRADGKYWESAQTWITADSVWGHVGYRDVLDWRENAYVLDVMAQTIEAFRMAWKDRVHKRCPSCHRI